MDIILKNKRISYIDFLNHALHIKTQRIVDVLLANNVTIKKHEVIVTLKQQLDELLPLALRSSSLTIEYKRRLEHYQSFSLYQLVLLADSINEFNLNQFKEQFLSLVINSDVNTLEEIMTLEQDSSDECISCENFITHFTSCFTNEVKDIDGVSVENTILSLTDGTTLEELKGFAKFNNLHIPRRLRKEELKELIIFSMRRRGMHVSNKLEQLLNESRISKLEKFADAMNLPCKVELRKNGIYEYILRDKSRELGYIVNQVSKDKTISEMESNNIDTDILDLLIQAEQKEELEQEVLIATIPVPEITEIRRETYERPGSEDAKSLEEEFTIDFEANLEELAPIIAHGNTLLNNLDQQPFTNASVRSTNVVNSVVSFSADGETEIVTEQTVNLTMEEYAMASVEEALDRVKALEDEIELQLISMTNDGLVISSEEEKTENKLKAWFNNLLTTKFIIQLEKAFKYFGIYVIISISLFGLSIIFPIIEAIGNFSIGPVKPLIIIEYTRMFGSFVMAFIIGILEIIGIG